MENETSFKHSTVKEWGNGEKQVNQKYRLPSDSTSGGYLIYSKKFDPLLREGCISLDYFVYLFWK